MFSLKVQLFSLEGGMEENQCCAGCTRGVGPSAPAWHMALAGAVAGEEVLVWGGTGEATHDCCVPAAGAEQQRPRQALSRCCHVACPHMPGSKEEGKG